MKAAKVSKATIYLLYAVYALALGLLLGVNFYKYYRTGEFNFWSIITALMLVMVFFVAKNAVSVGDPAGTSAAENDNLISKRK